MAQFDPEKWKKKVRICAGEIDRSLNRLARLMDRATPEEATQIASSLTSPLERVRVAVEAAQHRDRDIFGATKPTDPQLATPGGAPA